MMFSHLVKHENQSRNLLHYMLYLYIISFICIGCILSTQQYRRVLKLTYKESCYVLGMSVCFVLSTYYFAQAFRVAPNPAFETTIANSKHANRHGSLVARWCCSALASRDWCVADFLRIVYRDLL